MRAQVQLEEPPPPALPDFITQHIDPFSGDDDTADIDAATGAILSQPAVAGHSAAAIAVGPARDGELAPTPISRNAPCPCGSGRKYKHCHGQLA